MEGYLYCGLAVQLETMEIRRSNLTRWWVQPDNWPDRAPREIVRRCVASAMGMWAGVANVKAIEVSSEAEADFVVKASQIDGRQGVLADCMLPGPRVQVCRCDNAEMWTVQLGPAVDASLIDLDRVLRHEIGHFWGIGHDRQGAKSLMAPTYSRSIWQPQEWDVQQIQSLYGPPVQIPTPPTAGQPGEPYYIITYDRQGVEVARFRKFE